MELEVLHKQNGNMVTIGKINLIIKCPIKMVFLRTKSVVSQRKEKRTLCKVVPKMLYEVPWSMWAKLPVSLVFTK